MRLQDVTALFSDLEVVELTSWIERGWVQPDPSGTDWEFREIDVARIRLIRDLRRDMDVTEDAVALVLPVLDQLYDLRAQLRRVLTVLERQPEDVRAAILADLR